MKKNIKAIVFDFDGVLADTYDFAKELAKKVGHAVSHENFKAHHDGNVFEHPRIPFTKESADNFFLMYSEKICEAKPFFSLGNIKIMREFCPLFIISSNKEDSILKFLNHNKLKYFQDVLGVDFHKSKIEKFKYLFQKYKFEPEEVVFITDTLGDILEAKNVGVRTIAVDFGFHERERLEKGSPFRIVSNVEDIIRIIKDM